MKYNYITAMKEDIKTYFEEIGEDFERFNGSDIDTLQEVYTDDLWTEDSVTGNASGSYTFNRWKAEEYVKDNLVLCIDAMEEFGSTPEEFGRRVYNEDWEYLDVTIRCYLLDQVLRMYLQEVFYGA